MRCSLSELTMQTKWICGMAFLALIIGLGACSRQEDQKVLARRLTESDRVVFTMVGKSGSVTFSNQQVRQIVHALDISEKIPREVQATVEYNLDFFKGANHVATVPASYPIF